MRPAIVAPLLVAALVSGCGCGSSSGPDGGRGAPGGRAATRAGHDWPRYGFDAARTNVGPRQTGIRARTLRHLRRRQVHLPGTVDSSPIYLHDVRLRDGRTDVFFVTTTYGRTLAISARSGRRLWQFVPPGIGSLEGSDQITNTTPVADPSRHYIYAASPDGLIHKLSVRSGREARGWPVRVTRDPTHEKLAAALNLSGRSVIVVTGGYLGDEPPYQGHVLLISRRSGRIRTVFNTLCSDRHGIIDPRSCGSSDSAIWGRAGAVVEPGSHRLIFATGNGPFNGRTDWGDSVLELSPDARHLLQSYTPGNHADLASTDSDLGSTVPALLPRPGGRRLRYAVQGGKDGKVRLLSLARLNGRSRSAGPLTGGELQVLDAPRGPLAFTTPAVLRSGRRVLVLTADLGGTVAYELRRGRLAVLWQNGSAGSSPVLAGGLMYVYDVKGGGLRVYAPRSGRLLVKLPAGSGHWNSPVVADGRIALPQGNANDHSTSGMLNIYSR